MPEYPFTEYSVPRGPFRLISMLRLYLHSVSLDIRSSASILNGNKIILDNGASNSTATILTLIQQHFRKRRCTCATRQKQTKAAALCKHDSHHPTPFPSTMTLVLQGYRVITSLLPPSPNSSGTISKPMGRGR